MVSGGNRAQLNDGSSKEARVGDLREGLGKVKENFLELNSETKILQFCYSSVWHKHFSANCGVSCGRQSGSLKLSSFKYGSHV